MMDLWLEYSIEWMSNVGCFFGKGPAISFIWVTVTIAKSSLPGKWANELFQNVGKAGLFFVRSNKSIGK